MLVVPAVAGVAIVLVALLVGAGSLVVRFRRARGVERQQLRWLAYAAALAAGLLLVALVAAFVLAKDEVVTASLALECGVTATGDRRGDPAVSALRPGPHHQPHARPGLLTILLGGGYAGVVLGLRPAPWSRLSLVVAGATLVVAAVFRAGPPPHPARWTGVSIAAATMPPRPSPSAPACVTRST